MRPRVGDRIEVIGTMINDPAPMEIGATGTVTEVFNEGGSLEQVAVSWDNGRSLLLVPDDYRIIRRISS